MFIYNTEAAWEIFEIPTEDRYTPIILPNQKSFVPMKIILE